MSLRERFENYRVPLSIGFGLFLVGQVLISYAFGLGGTGSFHEIYLVIGSVFLGISVVFIVFGMIQWKKQSHAIDERFLVHRLKASRASAVVGFCLLGAWLFYEQIVFHTIRYEILVILAAMAISKIGLMLYYRKID